MTLPSPKRLLLAIVPAIGVLAAVATTVEAKCTRLGFSVNDYGKDGPTKDAKSLLDKYIAEQMGKQGITKYTVGKKDVTCELFLDFIVFDEHTCRAEATVCWPGSGGPGAPAAKPSQATTPPAKLKVPAKTAAQ